MAISPVTVHDLSALGGFSYVSPPATRIALAINSIITAVETPSDYKQSVRAATATSLPAYARTSNTLLANANGALGAIDGVTLVVGNRVLVKNGAAGADNGIYTIVALGAGGSKWSMLRATDADTSALVTSGMLVPVEEGTVNISTIWELSTANPITLNTTALTFAVNAGAINRNAGTVAPVGTQAAGTSNSVAAADHAHAHGNQLGGGLHADAVSGVSAGFLTAADKAKIDTLSLVGLHAGDGSDGAAAFVDGGAAVTGCTTTDATPGATVYTLDRDIFCTTVSVAATVTVRQNGFRILAQTSVANNGTIVSDGLPGAGGGAGGPAGTTAGGTAGGADKAGAGNGNTGTNGNPAAGGLGGAGGNSDGVPTETGGAAGTVTFVASRGQLRTLPQAALGFVFGSAGAAAAIGGTGGGSGGASAGSTGGGGGGGGGVGAIVTPLLVNSATGVIRANGGLGKAGVGAAGGGGGGGGGGVLLLVADTLTNAGSLTATAGAGGAGAGTGIAGAAGAAGSVFQVTP